MRGRRKPSPVPYPLGQRGLEFMGWFDLLTMFCACFCQPPATKRPKTLNAGFRPTHPLDYEPESGRIVLRCHSAKALLTYPQLRSISWHQGKVLKKLSKRAQHLPPSGVLTNRGQDVAHLVQTRGSYLNGTIKVKGSESSCDD
jgi:hypothetical protein